MDGELLKAKIFAEIKKAPGRAEAYEDYLSACVNEGTPQSHTDNMRMRDYLTEHISGAEEGGRMYDVYRRSLLYDAKTDFDSFMIYLELDRPAAERFYLPRRRIIKHLVDSLQDLADGRLDELFISQPPRTGKSTVIMMFVLWVMSRDTEKSNLYCAYSDTITKAFYNGLLEIINDPVTYKYADIFPENKVVQTNSQEEVLDLNRRKRYHTFTGRSLYGTLNGATDCDGLLVSDDLIGGIEEALNKDRMISCWQKVENNMLTRAKGQAKILWIGTRWSTIDPIGLRTELLVNDERFRGRRFRIVNIPALNEADESNFDYDYGVGFSTEYYRQRRASFERNNDLASWKAQYMGEPIERDGALFTPGEFRYYNGVLPEENPDRVFIAVDPAFGGGDFLSAPICFQYGDDIYVHDVVYSDKDKTVTQPLLVKAVKDYGAAAMQIEGNKATEGYKDGVEEMLKADGVRINLTSKPAPNNKSKEQRIYDKAPDIREHMIFREDGTRTKAYELFMQNVYSFTLMGKNKHDDAPDSLAMAVDMAYMIPRKLKIFQNPFM